MVASHTRRCRVPPHFVRRLARSAPQSTGLQSHLVKVTRKSTRAMPDDHIAVISAHDPVDPAPRFARTRSESRSTSFDHAQTMTAFKAGARLPFRPPRIWEDFQKGCA